MQEQETIIVAIELGSSKTVGIAGKMKDGTMQILAYAEDKTNDCIKRGVVYNIEKTTQSIRTVISRLETVLKMKITRTYIGLGGQSIRSVKSVIKKNMLTPTYINQTHIDAITDESHEVPFDDYELIGYFTQGFLIDNNNVADPVGVMGTNIEGEFLNVIANIRLRNNIKTSFENLGLDIADYRLSAFELANNLLTDAEKRSGTALVDFGAGTTTVSVLKNNIVRQIVTLPLGINNVIQDLCDLQIEFSEANKLMLTYADANIGDTTNLSNEQPDNPPTYTTSDGRQIEITQIQHIIEARLHEILVNIEHLLATSDYADKLLGGIVITGGGANIKNMEQACTNVLKAGKVRIGRKLVPQLIKNSDITALSLENTQSCTIVSLLLSGNENCVGEAYNGPNIFDESDKQQEINAHREQLARQQKEEEEATAYIENIKAQLRSTILQLQQTTTELENENPDKKQINAAQQLLIKSRSIINDEFLAHQDLLADKDHYKQTLREAKQLIEKNEEEGSRLEDTLTELKRYQGVWGKLFKWFEDLMKE